jgi:hypothetical protein
VAFGLLLLAFVLLQMGLTRRAAGTTAHAA